MNNVNQTLYIPLYGKAFVSRKGILLRDRKAEEIWKAEGFPLKGKSRSKWLAYYMGMRSAVFDAWVLEKMSEYPDAVIVHIGCGMDSRAERIGTQGHMWFDLDFPEVITERMRYYSESETYRMLSYDVRDTAWFSRIPMNRPVIMVMEGVSMYLTSEELTQLMKQVKDHFANSFILMDCYTVFAAKASKYKNPIHDVGVTQVYGIDDPQAVGLTFVKEHDLTPDRLIDQLYGTEKKIFKAVFAGSFARRIYRLYEFSN